MTIISIIQNAVKQAVLELYNVEIAANEVICSPTRKEFEGDYTVTVFNFAKAARKAPPVIGQELGAFLTEKLTTLSKFNVIQGFLNLSVSTDFWTNFVTGTAKNADFGQLPPKNTRVMVEYSSPNTNKPLHLGHIRNILLGWSCSRILESAGYDVVRTKVVNDRGIAICKSMLAWQLWGEGKTPSVSGIKGDHFVGDYYVLFEKNFKEEYFGWQGTDFALEVIYESKKKAGQTLDEFFKDFKNEYFNNYSELGKQAREMLLRWEAGDAATRQLWAQMNGWVYEGFNETYAKLGVHFDKIYYESDQYSIGKEIIEDGLLRGVFYQKPDTSVWIDLTDAKLDHKLVLRSDGTSVYITQDIAMARLRENDFHARKVGYVVADEQNYHFQVLFEILKKLGEPYADGLFHLSYGMVELPSGKMKSREGTVVDADDLIQEVINEAQNAASESNTLDAFSQEERADIIRKIGLAALKYHIVKVNPKKKMVFDPKESVDLQGHTGPYIQYAYVRAKSVEAMAANAGVDFSISTLPIELHEAEKSLAISLYDFPKVIEDAAAQYDPSVLANYLYDIAKGFSKFWHDVPVLKAHEVEKVFRLKLAKIVARTLAHGMDLLGIEMPERM
ncbi:MAG: arginine--tRNA ligase [Saprospiraceae bacterium]|nr:arginine--tRNA ligase [Saprospiraceae bacterium]